MVKKTNLTKRRDFIKKAGLVTAGVGATTVPAATFTVGVTTAGKITLALGSTATDNLSQGRYLYNVLVSSGGTIYNMIDGNILVYTGISSAPS